MVSVECQPTARASVHTLCQRLFLTMATARTILARVRWVDRYKRSTGTCCLVGYERSELRPRRILNAFGEAVIVHHLIDGEVFYGNDIEAIDHTAALLMGKVGTSVTDPLMHSADDRAAFLPLRGALGRSRQLALGALQVFLIRAQKLGTGCLL